VRAGLQQDGQVLAGPEQETHSPAAFIERSPLLRAAYECALESHHGKRRRGETDIDHPVAVAELLDDAGFDEGVVAAALLHDVVEDSDTTTEELDRRFGPEIAALVGEMTEDARIRAYPERKAEHRGRVAGQGRVAAIYAADKLASSRTKDGAEMPPDQLDHYIATLAALSESNPGLPFLGPLRDELQRLERERRSAK
jgi:(p)ppGpp synthase/HD superfamily hydrolase